MRFCGSRGRRDSVTLSSVPPSGGQRWHYSLWLCPPLPWLEGKGVMRGYLRADPLTADLETASLLLTGRLKVSHLHDTTSPRWRKREAFSSSPSASPFAAAV